MDLVLDPATLALVKEYGDRQAQFRNPFTDPEPAGNVIYRKMVRGVGTIKISLGVPYPPVGLHYDSALGVWFAWCHTSSSSGDNTNYYTYVYKSTDLVSWSLWWSAPPMQTNNTYSLVSTGDALYLRASSYMRKVVNGDFTLPTSADIALGSASSYFNASTVYRDGYFYTPGSGVNFTAIPFDGVALGPTTLLAWPSSHSSVVANGRIMGQIFGSENFATVSGTTVMPDSAPAGYRYPRVCDDGVIAESSIGDVASFAYKKGGQWKFVQMTMDLEALNAGNSLETGRHLLLGGGIIAKYVTSMSLESSGGAWTPYYGYGLYTLGQRSDGSRVGSGRLVRGPTSVAASDMLPAGDGRYVDFSRNVIIDPSLALEAYYVV